MDNLVEYVKHLSSELKNHFIHNEPITPKDISVILLLLIKETKKFFDKKDINLAEFMIFTNAWFGLGNTFDNRIKFWCITKNEDCITIYRIAHYDEKQLCFITKDETMNNLDIICPICFKLNNESLKTCSCGESLYNLNLEPMTYVIELC